MIRHIDPVSRSLWLSLRSYLPLQPIGATSPNLIKVTRIVQRSQALKQNPRDFLRGSVKRTMGTCALLTPAILGAFGFGGKPADGRRIQTRHE